jgi:hypothetical protein
VKLVISDAHEGLKSAIRRVVGASWQRCRVGLLRNALSTDPETQAGRIFQDRRPTRRRMAMCAELANAGANSATMMRASAVASLFRLGGAMRGMDADAFGGAMIDSDEHRRLALTGDRRGQVGPPHRIEGVWNDGAAMAARAARRSDP